MNILVYCSSRDDLDQNYRRDAYRLGELIADRGDTLVYGGGGIGLMGEVARGAKSGNGTVVGVIPERLFAREVAYPLADEMIVTKDMRERKHIMMERADAIVTLPGGFGTMEELFEALTHRYLEFHSAPMVILNSGGFYDPLISFFRHMDAQKMIHPGTMESFGLAKTPEAVFGYVDEQVGDI